MLAMPIVLLNLVILLMKKAISFYYKDCFHHQLSIFKKKAPNEVCFIGGPEFLVAGKGFEPMTFGL